MASDKFKRAMTDMFFHHALSRGPLPEEQEDFAALWRSMPEGIATRPIPAHPGSRGS